MGLHLKRRIVSKAAAYSVSKLNDECSTEFDNRGAEAEVIFTLPPPAFQYFGWFYRFRGIADFNLKVAGAANGDIVTKDDLAANSVSLETANEIIGGVIEATCIRTDDNTYKWEVGGARVGHTYTVAT